MSEHIIDREMSFIFQRLLKFISMPSKQNIVTKSVYVPRLYNFILSLLSNFTILRFSKHEFNFLYTFNFRLFSFCFMSFPLYAVMGLLYVK